MQPRTATASTRSRSIAILGILIGLVTPILILAPSTASASAAYDNAPSARVCGKAEVIQGSVVISVLENTLFCNGDDQLTITNPTDELRICAGFGLPAGFSATRFAFTPECGSEVVLGGFANAYTLIQGPTVCQNSPFASGQTVVRVTPRSLDCPNRESLLYVATPRDGLRICAGFGLPEGFTPTRFVFTRECNSEFLLGGFANAYTIRLVEPAVPPTVPPGEGPPSCTLPICGPPTQIE